MKVAYSSRQLTFEELKGSLSCLPKNNQWVRLGDSLPWDEFDKLYLIAWTDEYTDRPISDPSLFVTIRKRITIEDINALTLALAKRSEVKKGKKDRDDEPGKTHHTDIKVNATCADAEVKYLTDCGLLGRYIRNIQAGLSGKQHQGKVARNSRMLDRHVLLCEESDKVPEGTLSCPD